MKLLQLNAWGGRLEKQILQLLQRESPDVICLQEAVSLPGGDTGGFFITVEEIADKLGMHLEFSPVISFRFMSRTAAFGNAILSTAPITSSHTIFTRKEHVNDFDFAKDDYNIRNLLHVTTQTENGTLHVLTHHGHHVPEHKNGNEETMRQCKLIADYAQGLEGAVILTGDFNLAPHSESLEQINAVFKNLSIEAQLTTTRTALTPKTEVCDYVFTSSAITVQSFNALDDIASDHKALLLDFAY